jgi:transposase-like protein
VPDAPALDGSHKLVLVGETGNRTIAVDGVWRYVYRAADQHGQVIDVLLSPRRDAAAARRFFTRALRTLKVTPSEVVTDAAPVYPAVLEELVSAAWHHVEQYANNPDRS